jgi:hypothetical protein
MVSNSWRVESVLSSAIIGLVYGAIVTFNAWAVKQDVAKLPNLRALIIVTIASYAIVVVLSPIANIVHGHLVASASSDSKAYWVIAGLLLGALALITAALTLVTILRLGAAARTLSDRQLQITGLILTLVGIATQFISPVLDLLNVKIV